MMKLSGQIFSIAAWVLLAASCAVLEDLGEMASPDTPYTISVSGLLLGKNDGKPVSGLPVYLLTYSIEDVKYADPLDDGVAGVSAADGSFTFRKDERISDVTYCFVTGGADAGNNSWKPCRVEINAISGSPSYDSSTNTYNRDLGVVYLEPED